MGCLACKRDKEIAARGLCRACYQRWHKTGSTDYQRWGKSSVCEIVGCAKTAVSNGLCDTHRKRMERHGHIKDTRADSWGAIQKHPLRNTWYNLRRLRGYQGIAPSWEDDFLTFCLDVGDKPTPKHKLYPIDESKPIGPGNFAWKKSPTERRPDETAAEYVNRRARNYRAMHPKKFKGYGLKNLYGLTIEQYEAALALNGSMCTVCHKPENAVIKGRKIRLALDHCHVSGKLRGFLCMQCNTGLGNFCDDPEILRRAIAYLERSRSK
jgi:hypothetical protein